MISETNDMIYDDMQSKNKRGRPSTGVNVSVGVRFPPEELKALDHWRAKQEDLPNRPEAIRRILQAALALDSER